MRLLCSACRLWSSRAAFVLHRLAVRWTVRLRHQESERNVPPQNEDAGLLLTCSSSQRGRCTTCAKARSPEFCPLRIWRAPCGYILVAERHANAGATPTTPTGHRVAFCCGVCFLKQHAVLKSSWSKRRVFLQHLNTPSGGERWTQPCFVGGLARFVCSLHFPLFLPRERVPSCNTSWRTRGAFLH